MKRFFDFFNLLGIGVLTLLCFAQWSANGRLGRENDRLETIRLQQANILRTQEATIKGQAADLNEFRDRLTTAEAQLKKLALQLSEVTAQRDRAVMERDQLKAQLAQWQAAVKQRDALIEKAGTEIQALSKQRNDAVTQFNDLVARYNALAKQRQSGQ
jgi:chromosome segregation ATPase